MCLACRERSEICTVCANGKYSYKAACLTKCLDKDYSVEGVGNLRLTKSFLYHVPYQNVSSGYIEIMVNKTWKGVCSRGFNMKAAAVVCHHLGYGDPVSFFSRFLDYRLGMSEMIAFNCTGNEASFEQCSKGRYEGIKWVFYGLIQLVLGYVVESEYITVRLWFCHEVKYHHQHFRLLT